jgi:O-antigen ligase
LGVVPRTIQTLTAPKYRTQIGGEAPSYTFWTVASQAVLGLTVLAYAVVLVIDGLARNPHRALAPLMVLIVPWAYLELRDWTAGVPLHWQMLLYPMVLAAIWIVRPGRAALQLQGYFSALVAFVSIAVAVILPAQGIFRTAAGLVITEDKTILPLGILVGIFTHGNNLGQFLALGLPAVAMIRRRSHRVLALAVTCFALLWSASRSALFTAGLLAVVMGLLKLVPPARRGGPIRLALVSAFAAVIIIPLITEDPTAFSNRGGIWGAALQAWQERPLVGWGSRFFWDIAQTSENLGGTVYHAHNQFLQLLVYGGLVLFAAVAVMIATAITISARTAKAAGLFGPAFLLAVAGTCVLEPSMVLVDNQFLMPVYVLTLGTVLLGNLSEDPQASEPPETSGSSLAGRETRKIP